MPSQTPEQAIISGWGSFDEGRCGAMIGSPTKNLGQKKSFKMLVRRNSNTFVFGSKDLEFGVKKTNSFHILFRLCHMGPDR